jgi:hypothetical protein
LPVTGPSDVIGDSGLEAEPTPDKVPAVKGASIPTTALRVIVWVFPLTRSGEGCASGSLVCVAASLWLTVVRAGF